MLISRYFSQRRADLLLCTTAGTATAQVLSALNALPVPVPSYDTPLYWIVNYRPFVKSLIAKPGLPMSYTQDSFLLWLHQVVKGLPMGRIVSFPISLAVRWIERFRRSSCQPKRNQREIHTHTAFNSQFDCFWERLRKQHPKKLLAVRDRLTLSWHFEFMLQKQKVWIFTIQDADSMTAYSIFCRTDNPEVGLTRMRLIDFQTIDEEEQCVLLDMISYAMQRCQREGIAMLEVIGFQPEKRTMMQQFAPYMRKLDNCPFYYKAQNPELATVLADPDVWDPSPFDGDASLFSDEEFS